MKILVIEEIHPLDKQNCNSSCVYNHASVLSGGRRCTLFDELLKTSDGNGRCKRTRECRQGERRALKGLSAEELEE